MFINHFLHKYIIHKNAVRNTLLKISEPVTHHVWLNGLCGYFNHAIKDDHTFIMRHSD